MKKRMVAMIICIAMMMVTLVGCSKGKDANATPGTTTPSSTNPEASGDAMYDGKTIIGQSSWIGFAPYYLADQKGFFDQYGADVEVKFFESKTDSKSALAAKRIQGMSTSLDTHVMSAASGMNITVVMALDTSNGGDGVTAKKEYTTIASLKGKKVALDTSGGASYFWFQYLLNKEGMTLDDVQAVNMSSGDAGAAFVAGEVDAAVTWEPWLSKAKETENGSVLIDSSATPGVIVDALAMDADFAKQYPGTVKAIISAWYDALDYIKTNPEDAYKIMAEYTGNASGEELKEAMEAEVKLYDEAGNKEYFKSEVSEIASMAGDLWVDMKLIDTKPEIATLINGTYLDKISATK